MKLTKANQAELVILHHFTPSFLKSVEITDDDKEIYFDWSDRGKGKQEIENRVNQENRTKKFTGVSVLYFGKRYRDLVVTESKAKWGETTTALDFINEPIIIAEFMAKSLNKPGIMDMWMLHNETLSGEQFNRLIPIIGSFIHPKVWHRMYRNKKTHAQHRAKKRVL